MAVVGLFFPTRRYEAVNFGVEVGASHCVHLVGLRDRAIGATR